MKRGDRVSLFSHDGFQRYLTIASVGDPSGLNDGLTCYTTNEGSKFYMKPELFTGRHYNAGDRNFWIICDDAIEDLALEADEFAKILQEAIASGSVKPETLENLADAMQELASATAGK